MGQQAPGAPTAQDVQDGIDHFASLMDGRSAVEGEWRNEGVQHLPLCIGQVGGIRWPAHGCSHRVNSAFLLWLSSSDGLLSLFYRLHIGNHTLSQSLIYLSPDSPNSLQGFSNL